MEFLSRLLLRLPLNFDFAIFWVIFATVWFPVGKDLTGVTVCKSRICLEEASNINTQINSKVNPCENFYEFVCGGYNKKNIDPATTLKSKIRRQITKIYQSPYTLDEHIMLTIQKKFYSLCEKEVRPYVHVNMFKNMYETVSDVLYTVGGWPYRLGSYWVRKPFDWKEATYTLRRLGYNHNIFLNISVVPYSANTNIHIFKVSLTRPIQIPTKEDMEIFELLLRQIPDIKVPTVNEIYEDIVTMVSQMQFFKWFTEDTEDPVVDELFTVSAIQRRQHSNFNWLDYMNKILHPVAQISATDYILISNPAKVVWLIDSLSKFQERILANFIIWRVLEEIVNSLKSPSCFHKMQEFFWNTADPLADRYTVRSFSLDAYMKLKEMVNNVKGVTLTIIKDSTFLNEDDKNTIIKMIQDVVETMIKGPRINSPLSLWLDEMEIHRKETYHNILSEGSYLRIYQLIQGLKWNYIYKKIYVSVDVAKFHNWNLYRATEDVLDYHFDDETVLPATLFHSYLFKSKRPSSLNYGALGTFIATGLTRKIVNALLYYCTQSKKTTETILDIRRCLLEQIKDHLHINGIEDGVDYEMLVQALSAKISYLAYEEWEKAHGIESTLDTRYSDRQLFWITAGSIYCRQPLSNVFHLSKWRSLEKLYNFYVGGIAMNADEFARDFNCRSKSFMNPLKKCIMF